MFIFEWLIHCKVYFIKVYFDRLKRGFMKFNVILEKAEEGGYNVSVPALDGCFTQGETEEEAIQNAREAIICYLEGLEKLNQIKSSPELEIKELEIAI
jgi:predicted RNase H-like HicB family nuclease